MAMGMPASGEVESITSARFGAPSRSICKNAFRVSFNFSAAFKDDSTTAQALDCPFAMLLLIDSISLMLRTINLLCLDQMKNEEMENQYLVPTPAF